MTIDAQRVEGNWVRPAERIENVRYAIRNVAAEAAKLEAEGRQVLYCNIGDPLKFDFATPPHLVEAVERAMREGRNGYAPSAGVWSGREAIAQRGGALGGSEGWRAVSPEDVLITAGVSEALDLAMTALLNPGDRILIPSPGYPLYSALAAKLGAEAAYYELDEARGWSLDVEALEAQVNPRTRAIVVNNPNNPTGTVLSRQDLLDLLEVARRHRLVVLSDEIYDRLIFDAPHHGTASLAEDVPVLTFNGLSKSHLVCGWRVGWVVCSHPKLTAPLRAAMLRLADARLCGPGPAQHAIAPALLGPQDHLAAMMAKLRRRRALVVERLRRIPGLSAVEPQAAFYVLPRIELPGFATDEAFVLRLLRQTGVLFVHGSGFGQREGTQHLRVVFLPPEEVLEQAMGALETFCRSASPQ